MAAAFEGDLSGLNLNASQLNWVHKNPGFHRFFGVKYGQKNTRVHIRGDAFTRALTRGSNPQRRSWLLLWRTQKHQGLTLGQLAKPRPPDRGS